jgi:chromate transporter
VVRYKLRRNTKAHAGQRAHRTKIGKLGSISFGGPIAHLGYLRAEFVSKRRWLDDGAYGDLVALGQFLPGPASSQVVFALGMRRAGWRGGLLASVGFTLPSAVLMIAFAYGVAALGALQDVGWLHGLKLAAVAVVECNQAKLIG